MFLSFLNGRLNSDIRAKRESLYRLAYAWCHNASLADDLTNEALCKALKSKSQLRDMEKVDSWLFKILHNCWYDYLRQQKAQEDLDSIVLIDEQSPDKQLETNQLVNRVRAAVALLPIGQRQVLSLVDLEGVSYQEVSQILDIPIGTVMSRLSRARISLKQHLAIEDDSLQMKGNSDTPKLEPNKVLPFKSS